MFDNVLIGIDGRAGGDDAVVLGRQLAGPAARVTLAYIYGATGWPPGSGGMFLEEQRIEAEAFLARERERWPGTGSAYACGATVGRGLHELAVHRGADVLVVGSTHRGIPGRVFIGDDTRAAFNGAPCAIAIAPHGYAMLDQPLKRIGVGYNDTPESRRALAAGRALAQRAGADVTVMWVLSPEDVRRHAPLPADWPSASAAMVNQAERDLAAIEGVHGLAVAGGPREELTKLADEVDLLIVGSRGHGALGGTFHGSVSSYLERHAGSALVVLPRPLDATEEADGDQELAGTATGDR